MLVHKQIVHLVTEVMKNQEILKMLVEASQSSLLDTEDRREPAYSLRPSAPPWV